MDKAIWLAVGNLCKVWIQREIIKINMKLNFTVIATYNDTFSPHLNHRKPQLSVKTHKIISFHHKKSEY